MAYTADEFTYNCAYCDEEQGHDHMAMMCADCYWDYDSLSKHPRRLLRDQFSRDDFTEEEHKQYEEWIKEAKTTLAEFEAKLEEGQDKIHDRRHQMREIEEVYGGLQEFSRVSLMDREHLVGEIIATEEQLTRLEEEAKARALTDDEAKDKERLQAYLDELNTEYAARC